MTHGGRAAILIQENAGSGNGVPFTTNILKNNTLRASIKMADIFCGKASVQTAIYVFEVNRPHDAENDVVRFINFSNDGYTRMNRKKSGQSVNLRDTDNAKKDMQRLLTLCVMVRALMIRTCIISRMTIPRTISAFPAKIGHMGNIKR